MMRSHSLTFYVVRCDTCGHQHRTVNDGFSTPERAYAAAFYDGWTCTHEGSTNVDHCPPCSMGAK